MSYLVLARKWRPKRFAELVGQEHVVRALTNALETGRVHHAFLFTGTRGVGKTTIARIFAKSLNCERGAGADPCGECETCLAIDAGRYIDLLEIDAASNTGVDNVRELIENAQYMPSRGRYKVYLIDEVHMLSKAAFNALLKTLEEPPEHVKFLFATTDPEKLLVTVLSRCLQFNLKRLDEAQIGGQITMILGQEGIAGDADAVRQLAKAADGSLRDGLSLLDQAIAYTGGALTGESVAAMLGTVDRARVGAVLGALSSGDGAALLDEVNQLAGFSPDWSGVLDALAEALHRIQVRQLVPGAEIEASAGLDVDALASALRPEVVQLWYQMALSGRRDLHLAPSARAGFEMAVLRMLAFRPGEGGASPATSSGGQASAGGGLAAARAAVAGASGPASGARASSVSAPPATPSNANASSAAPAMHDIAPPAPARVAPAMHDAPPAPARPAPPMHDDGAPWAPAPAATPAPRAPAHADARDDHAASRGAQASSPGAHHTPAGTIAPEAASAPPSRAAAATSDVDAASWPDLVANLTLRGPARELAQHAAFVAFDGAVLRLALPSSDDHLKAPFLVSQLANALAPSFGGRAPELRFDAAAPAAAETLHGRTARQRDERQSAAEDAFLGHPDVQRLMSQQGAKLVPDSIRPYED